MKLLRIAAWTVWFMLGWTALAHAGPVVAAIGGLIAAIKASALVQFLVGIALKVGASLIQRAMAKRQPQPGINGQLRVGGNNSFSFIVGDYATAGSLDYVGTWGRSGKTPNAYLTQVVTVSDMMQGGISPRIFINNELCEIDFEATPVEQGYPVKEYRRNGRDYMWVKVLDGTQTEADPFLLDKFGSDPERPWTADMIGAGSTIVLLTALLNRELLTAMPVGRFEPLPLPLYDPRKDTTVGGDGPHRWGQPETYEGTANLLVIAYNIERGIFASGEKVFGPGVSASRLPLPAWFAAMNECDVPTIVADGIGEIDSIYEPQFSGGYEIKVAEHEPADVLEELFKSCNGQIAENGGIYKPHVGAPGLPVMFLTDEDWIVTDPQELDPFKGLEQTFNGATATYPDPEAAWEMKDAPQRLFPDYEAEDDGRRLLADFQFNAVSSPTQVQRLMLSMVRDGRRMRFHRGTLPPVAFALEPLDTISWTSARNGYIDKLFLISSKDEMTNVNQGVAAQEVDPSDYNWTPGTDKLPWSVGPINPRWPAPIPVTGWNAVASSIDDADGTPRRPAIDLICPGDNDDVRAIEVEVRIVRDGVAAEVVFSGEAPYGDVLAPGQTKTFKLSGNWCLPNQTFDVSPRYLPFSGRELQWAGPFRITTLNIRLGADDIYPDGLIPELQEWLDDAIDWIGPGVRELIDDARRLVASILDQEAGNYLDRQTLRQEVVSSNADARAYALLQIEAATGPGSALAQALLSVQAGLAGKADTSALLALTARVTETEAGLVAVSQALVDVQAEIDGKADGSALLALTVRVTANEGNISSLSQALIDVNAAIDNKADSSAVLLLQSQVNSVETTANGRNRVFRESTAPAATAIGDLWIHTGENNRIYRASAVGSANWVLSEDQRIPQLVTDVTAVSNAVIALQSSYNDVSASANFRLMTSAGPSGYSARIGMEARAGGSGVYRGASLFIDVPSSTSAKTRVVMLAQQVVVMTAAGTVAALFDGDTTYINNARIRNLTATNIDVASLTATAGFFDNVRITSSLQLDPGVVIEGTIAAGAVTNSDDDHQTGSVGGGVGAGVWVDVADITIASPSGNAVFLYTAATLTRTNPTGGVDRGFSIRVLRGATVLRTFGGTIANNATITLAPELRMDAAGVGTFTYKIQMQKANSDSVFSFDATIIGQCPKK